VSYKIEVFAFCSVFKVPLLLAFYG